MLWCKGELMGKQGINQKEKSKLLKQQRLGVEKYNKQGELMKVVEYNDSHNIIVEFQDEHKERVTTYWSTFQKGEISNPYILKSRVGTTKYNNQGCLMKVVEYNKYNDIIVEFQDEYKKRVKTTWQLFQNGLIACPTYYMSKRLGNIKHNKQGCLMKVIEYNGADNITVEFQDDGKECVKTKWVYFQKGEVLNPYVFKSRVGETKYNKQGCLMKVIEYNSSVDVVVEFQDEYKWKTHTQWIHFQNGNVRNCYAPSIFNVGITGNKYNIIHNGKHIKEYVIWCAMIQRCYDEKLKNKYLTYKDVTCCKEWLLFENFYEWIHKQENFKVWLNTDKYCLDKDILVKGNKVYSPNTCCLVPDYINGLFATMTTSEKRKNKLPIGVYYRKSCALYYAMIQQDGHSMRSQLYETPEEAFQIYKQHKEVFLKQVAEREYNKGTISKKCYEAMMRWEVEIGD